MTQAIDPEFLRIKEIANTSMKTLDMYAGTPIYDVLCTRVALALRLSDYYGDNLKDLSEDMNWLDAALIEYFHLKRSEP